MSKKTRKEIEDALPGLKSEKVDVLAEELDQILALKRVSESKDGKVFLDVLKNNCYIALRKLIIAQKKGSDYQELMGLIAEYSANIDLLSKLQDIGAEKEIRNQLDEAVKEAAY